MKMRVLILLAVFAGLQSWGAGFGVRESAAARRLEAVAPRSTPSAGRTAAPAAGNGARGSEPITLEVDASDATRRITRVRLVVPAAPGPLTLRYPQWIPGTHGPTGPIVNVAGLTLAAAGKPLAWQRDPVDRYAFHCRVPPEARAVEVTMEYLTPVAPPASPEAFEEVALGVATARSLAMINWNALLLYPKGRPAEKLTYIANLRLPAGWKYGTALPVAREAEGRIEFQPVALSTLVDSPVLAGAHFQTVPLTAGTGPAHHLHLAGDTAEAVEASDTYLDSLKRLVAEAGALFGAFPYREYHFLLGLSDEIGNSGLEHHESSVNTASANALSEEAPLPARRLLAMLLPHEFVHSWNGKYRRPAGMVVPDFHQPQQTELLWIYEGLTQYLGHVLEVRSGATTVEQFRDQLAAYAAEMDHQRGRTWQSVADAASCFHLLFAARRGPAAGQRSGGDVYNEGVLIWLEADALIRRQSQGQRSLDDFCRRFFGGQNNRPAVRPYSLDDVAAALNSVSAHDWRTFLTARAMGTGERAPLGGIEGSGWQLVYKEERSKGMESGPGVGMRYSLGLSAGGNGAVFLVQPGSPAEQAGITPGMRLVAVNGRRFSPAVLSRALKAAKDSPEPIVLLLEDREYYRTFHVSYRDGERYPHLERVAARPDLLEAILKPLTTRPEAAPPTKGETRQEH